MSAVIDADVRATVTRLGNLTGDHPVLRRRDLLALGVPDSIQSAMVRRGELVRLRHGVYALRELLDSADPLERHRIDLAAAVAVARDPVWAFGPSSALLREMPLPFRVPDHLSLARSSGLDERALRRPSSHRLTIPDARVVTGPIDATRATLIRGVPTVDAALTAVSTAAELTSSRWRTALLDAALWQGASVDDLLATIDEWRHLGHRSELLDALERARVGAQTVLETFSRLALVEAGLPEPVLQHPFYDEAGLIGYVDMWWPTLRVIGEADGLVKYASRDDVIKEKLREDRLRALGLPVVRWTSTDVDQHPERVAAAVWRAARRAA